MFIHIKRPYAFCFLILVSLLSACSSNPLVTKPVPTVAATGVSCTAHTSNPVTLTMYYGSEKEAWMQNVVADFNSRHLAACDGAITVNATPIGSGDSMQKIIAGQIKPDVWSPAGAVWLTLLNQAWLQKYGQTLIATGATDSPPLVTSPVVIAMWKPEAEALGWPSKQIGWSTIAQLSTDPRGWAAYGHPEWGDFKFGHTHPGYSNSGLDAVIAENYAAANKGRGLTIDDVNSTQSKEFVANVESSVIHYGESTGFFADKMFQNGPGYLSAAVMYESLVVEANEQKQYPSLPYPVVAIYPKEGTFYSDHPFAVLQASWVTQAKQKAAQVFRDFLLSPEQQRKALQYGFRPANLNVPIAAPIDSVHGVDATQPRAALQVPSAEVVNAIESSWNQQRRKVDVMLVLDRSGSMNDDVGGVSKIEAAKQGLADFVNLLGDDDGLGLTVFSDQANVLSPISPLGAKRQSIFSTIKGISADGSTRLYNTVSEQVRALQEMPSKHIRAVVVLTDGMDNFHQLSADQLARQLAPTDEKNAGEGVKVFTIAYGSDADVGGLTKIANACGGQEYAGNPQNIRQVYLQISQFF